MSPMARPIRAGGRSPNFAAVSGPPRRAKMSAAPIRHRSWTTVATMSTPAGGLLRLAPPSANTTATRPPPTTAPQAAAKNATGAVHAGHRPPPAGGTAGTPSGGSETVDIGPLRLRGELEQPVERRDD